MTDGLKELFNGPVTFDDLADGEHELYSTNATTQAVIKDVQIANLNNRAFDSLPADINGFEIGDFSGPMAGHEIMASSSSLKVRTDSITPGYISQKFYAHDSNGDFVEFHFAIKFPNSPVITKTIEVAGGLQDFDTTIETVSYRNIEYMKVGTAYYCYIRDGNAYQRVYYWATAGSTPQLINATPNYMPCVFDHANGIAYYFNDSGNDDDLYKHTPAGGEVTVRSNVPETDWNSYPRAWLIDDWLFYAETSTLPTHVHAINVTNGAALTWTGLSSPNGLSEGWGMFVTYDATLDKYILFRMNQSLANVSYRSYPNATKTAMDGWSANTDNSTGTASNRSLETLSDPDLGLQEANEMTNGGFHYQNVRWYPDPANPWGYLIMVAGDGSRTMDDIDYGLPHFWRVPLTESSATGIKAQLISAGSFYSDLYVELLNTWSHETIHAQQLNSQKSWYTPDGAEIASVTYQSDKAIDLRITGIEVTL